MAGIDHIAKLMAKVPWKGALYTVGLSFLAASLISSGIAWFFFPEDSAQTTSASVNPTAFNVPSQTSSMTESQLKTFIDSKFFLSEEEGAATDVPEKPVIAEEDDAVRSSLPVKLMGTIYGGDPYTGIALVENSKNSINSFMVGDTLTDGAKVIEVLRERIIIMNNGRREYVDVQKTKLVRKRQRKKSSSSTPKKPGIAPLATNPPPSTFKEPGFERKGNEMTMGSDYREKMLTTDFTKVLQDAKATPNMVDGELRGFQLTRIRQDSIYEKAGLQNDDIVEEVNGVPLRDTAQAIKLLNSLRTASEIEVRVRRAGSVITMILAIQ
jgi:general secretion pathway protein C